MSTNEEFLRATMGAMDLVYNVARGIAPRPADAEDLVQETYLAALLAWRGSRRPRRVEPWLVTICLNLGRSAFRHRARRPREVSLEGVDAPDERSDVEREVETSFRVRALREAMWTLPDEQRIALTLVDLTGFSTAEAARIMGTPVGTVLSRLHRGRRALAVALADEMEGRP